MRKLLLIWMVMFSLVGYCFPGIAQDSVVLVAATDADLPPISQKDLRRLYLGLTLNKGAVIIRPLVNKNSPDVMNGFLQNVMFMSDRNYKRQLVARVFRSGGELPKEFSKTKELLAYISQHKDSITFVPESQAVADKNIRVLRRLW